MIQKGTTESITTSSPLSWKTNDDAMKLCEVLTEIHSLWNPTISSERSRFHSGLVMIRIVRSENCLVLLDNHLNFQPLRQSFLLRNCFHFAIPLNFLDFQIELMKISQLLTANESVCFEFFLDEVFPDKIFNVRGYFFSFIIP